MKFLGFGLTGPDSGSGIWELVRTGSGSDKVDRVPSDYRLTVGPGNGILIRNLVLKDKLQVEFIYASICAEAVEETGAETQAVC